MNSKDMTIINLEVNKSKIEQCANAGDGYSLQYNDVSGFMFYILLSNPSPLEIKAVSTSGYYEITFTDINDTAFFTFNFNNVLVGDCTFEPRLYDTDCNFPDFRKSPNEGIALNIVLVDTAKGGLVRGLRIIGLDNDFSIKVIDWCEKAQKNREGFTEDKHDWAIKAVHYKYTTEKLNKISKYRTSKGMPSNNMFFI